MQGGNLKSAFPDKVEHGLIYFISQCILSASKKGPTHTMKVWKTPTCLFAVMGIFFCSNFAGSPITTKQKNAKSFVMVIFRQPCVAFCLLSSTTNGNERGNLFVAQKLHPFSNKAPPVQS